MASGSESSSGGSQIAAQQQVEGLYYHSQHQAAELYHFKQYGNKVSTKPAFTVGRH